MDIATGWNPCGVGCSLQLGILDNQVVEINPSGNNDSVNKATLCVRGHFAHDFLNSAARLSQPMIRKDDEFTPVSWDEALDHVAERLIDIKKRSGPMSIGFLGSSKCTNEENYLFQKIARVIIETNNIDILLGLQFQMLQQRNHFLNSFLIRSPFLQ